MFHETDDQNGGVHATPGKIVERRIGETTSGTTMRIVGVSNPQFSDNGSGAQFETGIAATSVVITQGPSDNFIAHTTFHLAADNRGEPHEQEHTFVACRG